ncbi:hypothetical protein [Sphingomonas gei]|uniref:hypothetical protein n=1 Tax=Sphingomonas gei TaxID=1395960 RepID=UPI0014425A94|nr:hypothetical protein [Sphingomonas gei]
MDNSVAPTMDPWSATGSVNNLENQTIFVGFDVGSIASAVSNFLAIADLRRRSIPQKIWSRFRAEEKRSPRFRYQAAIRGFSSGQGLTRLPRVAR